MTVDVRVACVSHSYIQSCIHIYVLYKYCNNCNIAMTGTKLIYNDRRVCV